MQQMTSADNIFRCTFFVAGEGLKLFLPVSGDFCCLLITFANSLDPDQDRQNVGPDLGPNCLTF